MNLKKTFALPAAIALMSTLSSQAAVTLTSLGSNNYQVDFDPITFTANGGDLNWLIFANFFQSGSSVRGTPVSGTIDLSINGGPTLSFSTNSATGTFNATNGPLSPDDLLINISNSYDANRPTLVNGDSVVVSANNIVFNSSSVPTQSLASSVNTTIYDNSTKTASTNTVVVSTAAVPEPSSVFMVALGGLALTLRRNRK